MSPSAHTLSHLPSLLHSLTAEISLLPSRVAAYTSGLSLFPPQGPSSYLETPSLLHLDDCLRLLDTCLLGSWSISSEQDDARMERLEELREGDFAAAIIALCVSCNVILHDDGLEEHRATGESKLCPCHLRCTDWAMFSEQMHRVCAPGAHQSHA